MTDKDAVRMDRWLWAARFFKSRTLASKACDGGKVEVNGFRSKPHKLVKIGDIVEFSMGDWRRKAKVIQLSERRGPASVARLLYEDLSPPPPTKEKGLFFTPQRPKGSGRPTKQQRKQLKKLKGGW
jgi:ribosome-associated heat shock protein Hsp15